MAPIIGGGYRPLIPHLPALINSRANPVLLFVRQKYQALQAKAPQKAPPLIQSILQLLTPVHSHAASNSGKIASVYQNTAGMFYALTGINLDGVSNSACKFFDHDNDGDLDILLSGNAGANKIAKIYENNGSSFVEDTNIVFTGSEYGTADFADYDNDGDFDIFISGKDDNYNSFSILYQNNNGSFEEDKSNTFPGVSNGSVAFGDYDNDGDLDMLLTGEVNFPVNQSKLYNNTGGFFTEDTASSLTGVKNLSAAFGDYDNDGDLDILLTGNTGSGRIAVIYDNTGGVFQCKQ
jgi:hypothetical protein